MSTLIRFRTISVVVVITTGFGLDASASGYEVREQSAVGQGVAFAGSAARGDDPSMLSANPAASAWLSGMQGVLTGVAILPRANAYAGGASRAAELGGSTITGSFGGDPSPAAFVPAAYITALINDRLSLGFSATAPFGLVTKYDDDFVGRYQALTSSLRVYNLTPSVSYRLADNFALGVGLQIQYADARISNAIDFGSVGTLFGLGRLGLTPGSRDGRGTVTGDDTAIGWTVGMQWRPTPDTHLGLSFRSAVFHTLRGGSTFEGAPAPLASSFTNTAATAKLTTPESVRVGVAHHLTPQWKILGTVEWTNWSRFRNLTVNYADNRTPTITEANWRDTLFLAAGAEFRPSDLYVLRAGIAWDQAAEPNSTRSPRILNSNRYWLSVGASFMPVQGVELSFAYTHVFAAAPDVQLAAGSPGSTGFLRGNLSLSYNANANILALGARVRF